MAVGGRTAARTNVEVVQALFEAMKAGDLEAVTALIHPDIECIEPDSLFYGGVHRGRDAFLRDVLGAILANAELEIHDASARDAGDVVLGRLDLTFTARETGRSVRMPIVELYTVADGQIARIDVFPRDTKAQAEIYPESPAGR